MKFRLDPFSPNGVSLDNTTLVTGGGSSSTTGGVTSISKSGDTALTGAVTLTAGTNVSLVQTGQDIEISSTGGSGGGDVSGPASATDNAVTRFNGTTGKIIQNSGVIISDSNALSGVTNVTGTDANFVTGTEGTSGNLIKWNVDGDAVDTILKEVRIANELSSGIIEGGELSINANPALFDISDGDGVIVDNTTDPQNPVIYNVSWTGLTGLTVTNLATATATYVLIDNTSSVIQQTTIPTRADHREYIYLGQLSHTNNTSISSVVTSPDIFVAPISQTRDVEDAIGIINAGNQVSANGANLQINKSTGTLTASGINYYTDPTNPSQKTYAAQTGASLRMRTQTGAGSTVTNLDVGNYDNAGTVTAVSGVKAQNFRFFLTLAGNVVVQYGQVLYNNLVQATAGLQTETFTIFSNLERSAALIGVASVLSSATDLSNTSQAIFYNVSKFGELGGAGAGVSVSTMQNTYNNSIDPEIVTDSTRGAVTIKRGSAADTNAVLEVQNGAGSVTASITGAGVIAGSNLSGTNTGDQTSIVGITGTTAQFNTALTDNDFATLAGSETLTNKTLTTPTIGNFTNAGHNHTNAAGGGQLTATTALNATGTPSSTTFLRGDNTWSAPTGDVAGPASATDNAITRYDGTTGKLIQNSTEAILTDTGRILLGPTESVDSASSARFKVADNDGSFSDFALTSYDNGWGSLFMSSAGGTPSSPSNTAASNRTGEIIFQQFSGGAFSEVASIVGYQDGKVDIESSDARVSNVPIVTTTGTQTLTNKTLTAPKLGSAGFIADVNGNEVIKTSATVASAVNEITVTNAATATNPSIAATGGDTNISLNLVSKGSGAVLANGVQVADLTSSQTFLSKTIDAGLNTISGLTNSSLSTASGALGGAWQSWTPTWTNLTVGNGTVTARYTQVGKTVKFRIGLVFGSTTSVSGSVSFSLPVTAVTYSGTVGLQPFGTGRILDAGTASYDGAVLYNSTTTANLRVYNAAGTYLGSTVFSSTVPFTWTTNDEFYYTGQYEAA